MSFTCSKNCLCRDTTRAGTSPRVIWQTTNDGWHVLPLSSTLTGERRVTIELSVCYGQGMQTSTHCTEMDTAKEKEARQETELIEYFFSFVRWKFQSPRWRWQCIAGPSGFRTACGLRECGLARFPFWVARRWGRTAVDVLLSDCQYRKGTAPYGQCGVWNTGDSWGGCREGNERSGQDEKCNKLAHSRPRRLGKICWRLTLQPEWTVLMMMMVCLRRVWCVNYQFVNEYTTYFCVS